MVFFYLKAVILFLVSWLVYANVKTWWSFRRLRKWGKQYGCAEAPVVPNEWPWGLERLYFLLTKLKGMFLTPLTTFNLFTSCGLKSKGE
jgi:hypothetical protein